MRCHIAQICRRSPCRALGTCAVFAACVLMAAAARTQEKTAAPTPAKTAPTPPKKGKKTLPPPQKSAVDPRAESVSIATPTKFAWANEPITKTLDRKADIEFTNAPLAEVVESLKKLTKLEIQLDAKALTDVNISSDTPVTLSAKNVTLRNALKLMLRSLPAELTWIAKDNVMIITTQDVANEQLEVRVYAVQDLVAVRPSYPFEGMYTPGVSNGGFPRAYPGGNTGPMGMGGIGIMGGMGAMGTGVGGGMQGGTGGTATPSGVGMFSVPDNPQSNNTMPSAPVFAPSRRVLAQTAVPPKQGNPAKGGPRQPIGVDVSFGFDMDGLIDTIQACVKPTTWDHVGGPASISAPMQGMLVISQTAAVHDEIEKFLEDLRASSPGLKTVSVRATWLLLGLKQLDELTGGKAGNGIDHNALNQMAAKAKGYIGAVTCLNGQTVHIASGRNHSAVVGAVPVVGGGGEGENVGYQPIVSAPQSGAMLQVTPLLLPNANSALLDLCTSVTRAEISVEPIHFLGGEKGDAKKNANGSRPAGGRTSMNLDRVSVVVGQLATTLRVPLGQPTLVGGLTREPATDEQEAADTPQLYLFIEATVK
jgi:hypothetical protein